MTYLSFIPIGRPASSRLAFRPIYPQEVETSITRDGRWVRKVKSEDDEILAIIAAALPLIIRRH